MKKFALWLYCRTHRTEIEQVRTDATQLVRLARDGGAGILHALIILGLWQP